MPTIALFGINIAFAFTAWAVVTALYIWPALRARPRIEALRPLLVLNAFRFGGLSFLMPGVVSPDLPIAFARDAAFGDIIAAVLALLSLAALRTKAGIVVVWLFNIWGTLDLLNAFYQAQRCRVAARSTRRRLFHSNRIRAAAIHYAWADIRNFAARRARTDRAPPGDGASRCMSELVPIASWPPAARIRPPSAFG